MKKRQGREKEKKREKGSKHRQFVSTWREDRTRTELGQEQQGWTEDEKKRKRKRRRRRRREETTP